MDHVWLLVVAPVGLGLLGFTEPCTLGSSLVWLKYLEGKSDAMQRVQTMIFAATRAIMIGTLGAVAAAIGARFLTYQRGFWIALGGVYIVIGILYFLRLEWILARPVGPSVARIRTRGAMALGVLFGLNIPWIRDDGDIWSRPVAAAGPRGTLARRTCADRAARRDFTSRTALDRPRVRPRRCVVGLFRAYILSGFTSLEGQDRNSEELGSDVGVRRGLDIQGGCSP